MIILDFTMKSATVTESTNYEYEISILAFTVLVFNLG
jgi:hypothetical protein